MNPYEAIFFRGCDLVRGRRTIERLAFLRRSQHWPTERLRRWQLQRLNDLLLGARMGVPLYRQRLAGLELPLRSLEAIRQLPVLTKEDLRRNFDGLQSELVPRRRFLASRTGGSTGEPTHFYLDRRGKDWNRASVYRSAEWAGTALGERAVHMSGSEYDLEVCQRLTHRLSTFLLRYRELPVTAVTEELLERYWSRLRRFRPASIWGYPSGIDALAAYIEDRHPDADLGFVRAVATSSEKLHPTQRQRIERVFGEGVVFDQYGSREVYIGSECRAHDGYHLHAEVVLVEIVDGEGRPCAPGELGRVLVTDLSNGAFPFIRYEIGDLGVAAEQRLCSCGVRLPRLQRIEGRIADVLVLPDRIVTPAGLTALFDKKPGVRSFQFRQESRDDVTVYLETDDRYDDELERFIRGCWERISGGGVDLEIVYTDEIPVPESGKRRFVVSRVAGEHLGAASHVDADLARERRRGAA